MNENKNAFVDIILPNYNKDKFLKESIDSIISQTYQNWQLYIIDDNSQDNSKKILNDYKNEKINIIYLSKNKGAAFCRNLGIRVSNSKYISFLDSDDYWSPNKLEDQIFFMEKFNYKFTYTNYIPFIVKNNKKVFKRTIIPPNSFNYNKFINNTSIGMSSMIIERLLVGSTKFQNVKICEDYIFKCEMLKKNDKAVKFNQSTMYYRITKNSLQSNKFRNLYWIWHINKTYNKLSFFQNLKSLLFIIISSIKKYGFK